MEKKNIRVFAWIFIALLMIVCFATALVLMRVESIQPQDPTDIITIVTTSTPEITELTSTTSVESTFSEVTTTEEEVTTESAISTSTTDLTTTTVTTAATTTTSAAATTILTTLPAQIEETTTTSTTYADGLKVKLISICSSASATYYLSNSSQIPYQTKGGSGRVLLDCGVKEDEIKGSVACRSAYELYGYNYENSERTKLYIRVPDFPGMTGYYYLDDCCAAYNVVDFYFGNANNCPFKDIGRIFNIEVFLAT